MSPPPDHKSRLRRALLSLEGLSVGDAFGERFFGDPVAALSLIEQRITPARPRWGYTDDTVMALGVVEVLDGRGKIDRDELAQVFARRYERYPMRGYGEAAAGILLAISQGVPWDEARLLPYGEMGSMGNGAAMRVAPLGAYFAGDFGAVVEQARASAEVTHAHPDAQAGAIAVAVAAALASHIGDGTKSASGRELLEAVIEKTPQGDTRDGLIKALTVPFEAAPGQAANELGSGLLVLASDTVPFALWCAARHLGDYVEAMWCTVAGLGDRDTTCAIAGGVVALSSGWSSIPQAWRDAREPLELALRGGPEDS